MAVVADAAAEGAAEEQRHAEACGEIARVVHAFAVVGLGRVELLHRDHVGARVGAERGDVVDRVVAAAADATVDVVRHHAEGRHEPETLARALQRRDA